jgi:hypothetical protein
MMDVLDDVIDRNEKEHVVRRKLSSLERARVSLRFMDMNENPSKYLMDFRYVDRDIKPSHAINYKES